MTTPLDPDEPGWTVQGGTSTVQAPADVVDPIPDESHHPASYTARMRRELLTGPDHVLAAKVRQLEYEQKLGELEAQPRN
jgi:hypothetical protein